MSTNSSNEKISIETIADTNTDDEQAITKDDLFHLLQSNRRRLVLAYLRERDEEVTLGKMAEQVAAWENNTTPEELSSDKRQAVYISLYQVHLDKLEQHSIVDYNKDRGLVTRGNKAAKLDPYIEVSRDDRSDDQDNTESTNHSSIRKKMIEIIPLL